MSDEETAEGPIFTWPKTHDVPYEMLAANGNRKRKPRRGRFAEFTVLTRIGLNSANSDSGWLTPAPSWNEACVNLAT